MNIRTSALAGCLVPAILAVNTSTAQELNSTDLGAGYAHLLSVVAQPEIAASGVDIDTDTPGTDASLDTLHIPYYTEFGDEERRWYMQASGGYAVLEQDIKLQPQQGARFKSESEWTAYSGMLEGGMIFPMGDALSLSAGISAGLARLENDTDFSGGVEIPPSLEGGIFNWDTNAALYRAHGAINYDEQHGDYRLKGVAHLTYSYVDSFSESGGFDGFSDDSGAAIFLFDVSRRVNSIEAERPVFLIGHLGSTHFLGGNRDQLGFDQYFEIGGSIGIGKYAGGILFILGDDVDGVSLVFNYGY